MKVNSTDVSTQKAEIQFPTGTKLSAIIAAFPKGSSYSGKLTEPVRMTAKDKGIEAKAHTDAATYGKGGSGTISLTVGAVGGGFAPKGEGAPAITVTVKATKGASVEQETFVHEEAVADGDTASFSVPFAIDEKVKSPDLGIQVTIEATTSDGKTVKTKTVVPILVTG